MNVDCVGALIRDGDNRVYLQRRSLQRRQLPGAWDVVGGHVRPGETPEAALAREVNEETGWQVRRIEAVIANWQWTHDGVTQRELDYLIEVDGDLNSPRLEAGKHDEFCWVGYDNAESVRSAYDSGNDALWAIVKRATRIRLTSNLRLEPIGVASGEILCQLGRFGAFNLACEPLRNDEIPAIVAVSDQLWDAGTGYSWIVHRRRPRNSAIGYGGLSRMVDSSGRDYLLQCVISERAAIYNATADLVKAILSFARNELDADKIVAFVSSACRWPADAMARSGMRPVKPPIPGDSSPREFAIRFRDDSPYDLDQEVVTGIGQIMVVPT